MRVNKKIVTTLLTLIVIGWAIGEYWGYTLSNDLSNYLPRGFAALPELSLSEVEDITLPHPVHVGPRGQEGTFQVISARGQYTDEHQELALSIWVEQTTTNQFEAYTESAKQQVLSQASAETESHIMEEKEVYISFYDTPTDDDPRTLVTLGGGYVFFPRNNIAVSFALYNPRLTNCSDQWNYETCTYDPEAELPSISDARLIASTIAKLHPGIPKS